MQVYEGVIYLVPDKELELPSDKQCMNSPPLKRLPSRPHKVRRREEGEGGPSFKRKTITSY